MLASCTLTSLRLAAATGFCVCPAVTVDGGSPKSMRLAVGVDSVEGGFLDTAGGGASEGIAAGVVALYGGGPV